MFLIKDCGPDLFIESHRKALLLLELECNGLKSDLKEKKNLMADYIRLLVLDEQIETDLYIQQNGLTINLNYFEEGFC